MKRVALFAHYDADAKLRSHILSFLEKLREVCDVVIFVSSSPLSAKELAKVEPFVQSSLLRPNEGFDFSMWQAALREVSLDGVDELILTNSSVMGPITPLAPILEQMAARDCDFWGLTDNLELEWHLQSYFLVLKRAVLKSDAFRSFWASVLPYKNKYQVIRSYEVGLTHFLVEQGFRASAYIPTASCVSAATLARMKRARRTNPTLFFPCELLTRGMPLVKVSLLRENPGAVDLRPLVGALTSAGFPTADLGFPLRQAAWWQRLWPRTTRRMRSKRPSGSR